MTVKSRISGKEAVYVARENEKRGPVRLLAPEGVADLGPLSSDTVDRARKAPPRISKPSAHHDQCVAPTHDLESHRKGLSSWRCSLTNPSLTERVIYLRA